MKITRRQLRKIIKEEMSKSIDKSHTQTRRLSEVAMVGLKPLNNQRQDESQESKWMRIAGIMNEQETQGSEDNLPPDYAYIYGIKLPEGMGISRFLKTVTAKGLLDQISSADDIAEFHNRIIDYYENCEECQMRKKSSFNLHPEITDVNMVRADSVIAMPFKDATVIRDIEGEDFDSAASGTVGIGAWPVRYKPDADLIWPQG